MSKRRALITCANDYMGPAIAARYDQLGLDLVCDPGNPLDAVSIEKMVATAGEVDILVANLAEPPRLSPVQDIKDEDWERLFAVMVDPLMMVVRAIVPQMLERGGGKIIAVTSAAPLRGLANGSAYCAARAAQNGFIKAVGLELARSNIQVNAIAQNYVNNNTYYPDDLLDNPKFLDHVKRNVPTNKVGRPEETAELAAYLASEHCGHMVGQIIPLAGGWTS
jgi:2-keto-3-deoxy-L-fuconate dehydrogenase